MNKLEKLKPMICDKCDSCIKEIKEVDIPISQKINLLL